VTGLIVVAVAAMLAACGESSSDSNEREGTYQVDVVDASFPSEQKLGQTTLLKLAVRNSGEETVPAVTVTINVGGKEGEDSRLPFGVHDAQAGLAQADRPVWVLAEHYPRFAGSSEPGGASTSNAKTFSLGPLKPGRTVTALWKLSAVKAGDWTVAYRVGAGLGTQVKAETSNGTVPDGSFKAVITSDLPETEVTDGGEVVEIQSSRRGGGE
jgi:hypothetical protein